MCRITRDRLRFLVMVALHELAETCRERAIPKAPWLRALLGLAWIEAGAREDQRWLFEVYWRAVTAPPCGDACGHRCVTCDTHRRDATRSLNGICRLLGREPTHGLMKEIEAARAAIGDSK